MWSQKPSFINVTTPVQGILYRTDNGGITWSQLPTAKGLATSLTHHRDDIVQLDFVDQDCGWAMSQKWNDLPDPPAATHRRRADMDCPAEKRESMNPELRHDFSAALDVLGKIVGHVADEVPA